MHEEIFRALENGATIITASRRLARVLTGEFHGIETELAETGSGIARTSFRTRRISIARGVNGCGVARTAMLPYC